MPGPFRSVSRSTKNLADTLKPGETVALVNAKNEIVGTLAISDIFPWDKAKYIKSVYGTERTDHPGGHMAMNDPRDMLLGGEVRVLPQPKHPEYGQFVLSPRETRAPVPRKGLEARRRVPDAQPAAPRPRICPGRRPGTADAGRAISPAPSSIRSSAKPRATTWMPPRACAPTRRSIDNKALGEGDKDEELWKKAGCDIYDRIILLGLDIKMFYAGPKEAIMHAIYRQNFGFTDIVIGRKHADAPYDDGKDIWDGLAAQRKFDELKGELLIQPVKVGFAAFYEELGRVGLVDEYGPKGYKQVSISGRELREKLRAGAAARPAHHAAGDGPDPDRAHESELVPAIVREASGAGM